MKELVAKEFTPVERQTGRSADRLATIPKLDDLQPDDLFRVGDDDLEQSIVDRLRLIDALRADVALRVDEFDRRQVAEDSYVLTTKQWLAHRCRLSKRDASILLRTGQGLARMPKTAEFAVKGYITSDGVRLLTAARAKHPDDFVSHEAVLTDAATYLDVKELRQAVAYWEQQVAYPEALAETGRQTARRRLSVNQTWDGMWSVSGELDPESGQVVSTALEALVAPTNLDPVDTRSHPQKTADALVDLCTHALGHGDTLATSGGEKPHVTISVDYNVLTRELADDGRRLPEIAGSPVSPETIERMTCDAGIVRIVVDSKGQPLDVGRRVRTVTPAIRRALDVRDGGCAWSGCDAPLDWCDAHHLVHWAHGGETSLDNLILLCRKHHTTTHKDNTTIHDPPDR
ncbi:MAG: DUF222 domain-containing protein [Acidimicrobiia bacterium]